MIGKKQHFSTVITILLFLVIPAFVFFVVKLLPFFVGLFMTFTDWSGLSSSTNFLGFENYVEAFTDKMFWNSMLITLKYVAYSLILVNALAFGLALLVTSGLKGQNTFRTGFFTPNLIGGVILGFIWQFVFGQVFVKLGTEMGWEIFSSSWLANPDKAFWTLVIVGVWQNSGYMMLIYIAGLMGLDRSLLEAAEIDGASSFQKLIRIKMPLIMPAFTISLFLTLQRSFMVYDTNLSLTAGGPFRSTELITMHVYNEAFLYQNFGPGQAKGFVLFLVIAVIALVQVNITKRMEVES